MKKAILIHGGAGMMKKDIWDSRMRELGKAASYGFEALMKMDNSIDAVVEAVSYMEDSGMFNAGRGSVVSFKGKILFDAAVADWKGGFGAVGGVPNIKNPVKLARQVMLKTDHRILVGDDAKEFGLKLGFKEYCLDELTGLSKLNSFLDMKGKMDTYIGRLYTRNRGFMSDTVGAVAINSFGEVAAAVSTGGLLFKLDGRVGDSAIYGAGIMADALSASVATGIGEYIIDSMLTYLVVKYRHYMSLEAACRKALNFITRYRGGDSAGLICIDRFGNMGWMHNTKIMGRAYIYEGVKTSYVDMVGNGFIKIL